MELISAEAAVGHNVDSIECAISANELLLCLSILFVQVHTHRSLIHFLLFAYISRYKLHALSLLANEFGAVD